MMMGRKFGPTCRMLAAGFCLGFIAVAFGQTAAPSVEGTADPQVTCDHRPPALQWTREFERPTDDLGDNIPVAITHKINSATTPSFHHVAVVATCTDGDGKTGFGLNIYDRDRSVVIGSNVLWFDHCAADGSGCVRHSAVPIGIEIVGSSVFIAGTSTHPDTGEKAFVIAGFDLFDAPGQVLPDWDPRNRDNHDWTIITLDGYELEAVRMHVDKAPVQIQSSIYITGNAQQDHTAPSSIFTVGINTSPPSVRWAHHFTIEGVAVVSDIDGFSAAGPTQSAQGRVWVLGTTQGTDGRLRLLLIQYDDELIYPNQPYPLPYVRWVAQWEREHAVHDMGARLALLRDPSSSLTTSGFQQDQGHVVHVVGLSQNDTGLWEYVHLVFDDRKPVPPAEKLPNRYHLDSAPGHLNAHPVVGIDARMLRINGLPHNNIRPHYWFGGWAPVSGSPDARWYHAQWREEELP